MDRTANVWGTRTPYGRDAAWPVRVDSHLEPGLTENEVEHWVQSACVLCSNGCACDIAVKDGRMVGVRGRAADVVNHGRLGPKGLYGSWQWSRGGDRLTRPLVREGGRLVETDWDTAMERLVRRSRELLDDVGPLSHGFYTTGQLFLEEYYTLSVVGKAGLGTPHMDGNTRLCTATAAAAMKESFGSDGQPGSYTDIDSCDALFLYGHNMAETQTVLWARVLDRLAGANPPRIVAVDPRRTEVAEAAARTGGVHIAPLPGTNQALMNGLVRELIVNDWLDHDYIAAHTMGFDQLADGVREYTPEHVAEICRIPKADIQAAAEIFRAHDRVLSTVLQGFYQSNQATAASCQVNNLHLLTGRIGRAGCGVLHMNGQPTAQNTRECGADGDLPGFRNWSNPEHVRQLAELWKVDPLDIPHWSQPTHAMQLWRYAEQGSIRLLWISGTNPAVSLPQLPRIRDILRNPDLFVVVQDGFRTETTEFADVVLPAAMWGEKQGSYTNVNRTVHLSDKAVEPPGEARSDLDIFLDYARRMDFRNNEGAPLIPWHDPESAFEAWKECSRGRLCDYTGLSYAKLRGGSGVPWPCNDDYPDGCDRLYADGVFPTRADVCESYGHDLVTGAAVTPQSYRAAEPDGRAFLRSAPYVPPPERPSEDRPFVFTSGRTVYHFHTRTKTGRSAQLNEAAPRPWVELSSGDAARLDVAEGDLVRVETPRGALELPAHVGRTRDGVVFVPFHYGYWDTDRAGEQDGEPRAANELTMVAWDPVSKQPHFKVSAAAVRRVARGDGTSPAPAAASTKPRTVSPDVVRTEEDIEPVPPPPAPPVARHTPNIPAPAGRD